MSDSTEKTIQSEIEPKELPRKRSIEPKTEELPRKKSKISTETINDENDNKSEASAGHKSSNGSSSTPDPASTPDEDRSDLGENGNLEHVTLFWFTEAALRMHDNPGLKAAVKGCKAVSKNSYFFRKNDIF